ncbi:hypothetical protein GCU67_14070 [Modestobacter muralis]|uniref:Uncharacterized protein n=1 Tax=Modestobacter muralis TaxID=1608614 RepID=A0A6P0H8E9_9ACTN|nr:hypothetical protein [Modestobacter muralis]NEK95280.1 hypothetical protein [Modestobacter muralis]NEN52168.1 hypothetical protein [Modestobacter muralis]
MSTELGLNDLHHGWSRVRAIDDGGVPPARPGEHVAVGRAGAASDAALRSVLDRA